MTLLFLKKKSESQNQSIVLCVFPTAGLGQRQRCWHRILLWRWGGSSIEEEEPFSCSQVCVCVWWWWEGGGIQYWWNNFQSWDVVLIKDRSTDFRSSGFLSKSCRPPNRDHKRKSWKKWAERPLPREAEGDGGGSRRGGKEKTRKRSSQRKALLRAFRNETRTFRKTRPWWDPHPPPPTLSCIVKTALFASKVICLLVYAAVF